LAHPSFADFLFGHFLKRTFLLLISSLLLGIFSFAVQHSASRPQQIQAAVQGYQKLVVSFEVLDEPKKFSRSHNYSASVRILAASPGGEQVKLSAKGLLRGDSQLRDLLRGARYVCLMSLSPTAAGERPGYKGRCNDLPIQIAPAAKDNSLVTGLRAAFMKSLRGVDSNSAGLVAGLAIGDVSLLDQSLLDQMKLVSLTHLTAVSGANCAIVLAMFYLLVRKLGGNRWWLLGVGIAALIGYVQLVGSQPSVLRAAVMAASVLIGVSLGRKTAPMSALALSVIVLLIADPWLSIDFGFALSVAATAGLLVLTQPIATRLQSYFPGWLSISISVSLAAQILCLPILLQLQSGIATYALPANVLAESLVAPVTVLGICACLIAWLFPPAAWCLTYLASEGTWLIAKIAGYFAGQQMSPLVGLRESPVQRLPSPW
jgi:competence protein ComEC